MKIGKPRTPTTFLSLPAELRNEIYRLSGCLVSSNAAHFVQNPHFANHANHKRCEESPECFCMVCSKDGLRCSLCESFFGSSRIDRPSPSMLWVNRNSSFHANSPTSNTDQPRLRHNKTFISCIARSAIDHAAHIENGVEQPNLTKVSRQVRNDTLPVFYGSHGFLLTLFDREVDLVSGRFALVTDQ